MEYLIGAIVATASLFVLAKIFSKTVNEPIMRVRYRQSHIFSLLGTSLFSIEEGMGRKELTTQSTKFFDSRHQKVLFFKGKAYWIKDNSIYSAELVNGIVDEKSTKTLDIMSMDKVELKDMMFIVDKLNEGQNRNDLGNSWK